MKIQILGTAAAEGWPAIFCNCETCKRARAAGGKDIRSRASLLVNGSVMVDLGPDTFHHAAVNGLDFSELRHVIFTHSHSDHCCASELAFFQPPFAFGRAKETVDIWGSADVITHIRTVLPEDERQAFTVHEVKPFHTVELDDLKATPVVAVHMPNETCLNWLFGEPDHAVLYTCDTGLYREPTWDYLSGVKLDMLISEATCGNIPDPGGHMSFGTVRSMVERLDKSGALNPGCKVVLTHFSHNIRLLHEEIEREVAADGFQVAYDGLVVETDA